MDNALKAGLAVVSAILGLAMLSVIVSRRSQTPQVISAAGSTLANVISAAVSPASTAATNGNPLLGSWATPSGAGANAVGLLGFVTQNNPLNYIKGNIP